MTSNTKPSVLAVDLDGSLIFTDLFFESLVRAIKAHPLIIFFLPFWYSRGIGYLKAEVARRAKIDIARLPYNPTLIDYLKSEARREYDCIVLCTGSHALYANQVAEHLQLFDKVIATTDEINLTGHAKANHLKNTYGEDGFAYVGNELKDRHVWNFASQALVVGDDSEVHRAAQEVSIITRHFKGSTTTTKHVLKAMRVHQWMKNLLLFVPLITAHLVTHIEFMVNALAAFVCFGLCASATYIINDLFDLDADRAHSTKCNRPFAAGHISIENGLKLSAGLMGGALLVSALLPGYFFLALITYIVVTLAYSFKLKKLQTVDVMVLAGLYTIRVIAGSAAIGVWPSFWLLAFSMFLFFSLAVVKRVSELLNTQDKELKKAKGRGYYVSDISVLQSLGSASGFLAVLVLALYINSSEVLTLYKHPQWLWLLCPLLAYWIMRVWMLTARREMDEDPITFAITDKNSWLVGALSAFVLTLGVVI